MVKTRYRKKETDPLIEHAMSEWAEFKKPSEWQRSKKGNPWRHWKGETITIFRRQGDDLFSFSIADCNGPRFSPEAFESEEDATAAAGEELGVGQ